MPFHEPQRTSVLPPMPAGPILPPMQSTTEPLVEGEPSRGRNPLVVLGVGVAAIAAVGGLVAFALSSSSGSGTPTTGHSASAPATTDPSGAPSPSVTDDTPTTAPPVSKVGPAAAIAQLRANVQQTPFNKDKGGQSDLTQLLDDAAQAVTDQRPDDAVSSLRDAQKTVRDLAKRRAIDGPTAQNWQGRLGAIINALHGQQAQTDNGN
jgi:serine/threonine-protein kinase